MHALVAMPASALLYAPKCCGLGGAIFETVCMLRMLDRRPLPLVHRHMPVKGGGETLTSGNFNHYATRNVDAPVASRADLLASH